MKPQLLKVTTHHTQSFSVRLDTFPNINNKWHYHKEIELIHFHNGHGMQFIGDHISQFESGDIVLVGSNLPHYWKYDDAVFNEAQLEKPYSTVIHFNEHFWGNSFLDMPETRELKCLLDKAKRGILLKASKHPEIANHIEAIYKKNALDKLLHLLQCLSCISNAIDAQLLASVGFSNNFTDAESFRIDAIYNYSFSHFKRKIHLHEIAQTVNLEPNSFCRYFKTKTGKTFSNFIQEIRVGYACKLLIEDRLNLKQVCFESGFNNFSCFHKAFKSITGMSPKNYKSQYLS